MNKIKIVGGLTGASTKVYIDGVLQKRIRKLSFTAKAGGINTVILEVYPESVEIEAELGNIVLHPVKKE